MYENVVNVPLIIWDTREESAATRASSISDLVSLVDIGPTVLDYAGVAAPRYLEGRSLAGYLRGESEQPRDFVVAQDNYMTMIRTADAKLVWYAHQEQDGELYDLRDDPEELFNRYNDSAYQALQSELMNRLLTWSLRSAYRTAGQKNGRPATPQLWPQESVYVHNVVQARPNSWADF
jgi:arylsulfatase A-like enzyme